jgi:hypothetical protein
MTRRTAAAFLLLAWAGCRTAVPPGAAVDPRLAVCMPGDASVLAGLDLSRLRASPLYPALPATLLATADTLRDASYAVVALRGKDLWIAARGAFHGKAPAGGTLLEPDLAVAGSSDAVAAAAAQFRAGRPSAAAGLLDRAEPLAGKHALWIVARGSAPLPLTGNGENLNRLLRLADFTTIAADFSSGLALDAAAVCRDATLAREFEETLRALLSLAGAANTRRPEIAGVLNSAAIRRDGLTVRLSFSAGPQAAAQLLGAL